MKYTYTEIDLLKSPQKYQQSQFHGKEFLLAFRHSRENIQNSISKRIPINTYPDLVTNPYVHISLDEKVNLGGLIRNVKYLKNLKDVKLLKNIKGSGDKLKNMVMGLFG